jgi:hypothetical protein
MTDSTIRYDEDEATFWVHYDFDDPQTLVPNDELRDWIAALDAGETDDGDPVEAVNYVFADEGSAAYNHQALAYADIGTYVGSLDDHEIFESEEGTPDFEAREDFGIE